MEDNEISSLKEIKKDQFKKIAFAGTAKIRDLNLSDLWGSSFESEESRFSINATIRKRLKAIKNDKFNEKTSIFDLPIVKIALSTPNLIDF